MKNLKAAVMLVAIGSAFLATGRAQEPTATADGMVPVYDAVNPNRTLLTPAQIEVALRDLPGWEAKDGHLVKTFVCDGFGGAVAFIVALSYACEKMDHHPEIRNVYHRVQISLTTYDAGAQISTFDVELAKRIEAVAPVRTE